MTNSSESLDAGPRRHLRIRDSVSMIVGIIVGAGIFETSPDVAGLLSDWSILLAAWFVGGLIAVAGALSYAELVANRPEPGGDYSYLSRAFGSRIGFLFAWCDFLIVRPCNLGMMAYVFARYALKLLPSGDWPYGFVALAASAVLVLGLIHWMGVKPGIGTLNLMTTTKVIGLLILIGLGASLIAWPAETNLAVSAEPSTGGWLEGLPLAMILILFTYGGWAEISFVAAEIRDPGRNAMPSLLIGVLVVTGIYVAWNAVVIGSIGQDAFAESTAIAHDLVVTRVGGGQGGSLAALVDVLICISCLGAMHGTLLAGSRLYHAWGSRTHALSWLGDWDEDRETPVRALFVQIVIAMATVIAFGPDSGAFQRLIAFSTPFYWSFFTLVALTVMFLHREQVGADRPFVYRMPLYPLPALILFVSSLWLAISSIRYAWSNPSWQVNWVLLIFVLGVVCAILFGRRSASAN